jgi:hypothetical protein
MLSIGSTNRYYKQFYKNEQMNRFFYDVGLYKFELNYNDNTNCDNQKCVFKVNE